MDGESRFNQSSGLLCCAQDFLGPALIYLSILPLPDEMPKARIGPIMQSFRSRLPLPAAFFV
jgi:hypothetical protein